MDYTFFSALINTLSMVRCRHVVYNILYFAIELAAVLNSVSDMTYIACRVICNKIVIIQDDKHFI